MEVMIKRADPEELQKPFIIENPFGANMLGLFNDEESADIVFEVQSKECKEEETPSDKKMKLAPTLFHAHCCVIKKGAPMLYELCKAGWKVRINDVRADVFGDLLRYLYGKELRKETLGANPREFINVADRYGAVHLKLRAEAEYVEAPLDLENAIDVLLYADAKNCALLKETVMDFLVENQEEAMKNISFDSAPGYLMKDLLAAVGAKYGKKQTSSNDGKNYDTLRVNALRRMLYDKGLDIDGSREAMIALLKDQS